jgi:uroporphyrinogen-III synthase
MTPILWLTRPAGRNEVLAEELAQRGVSCVIQPLSKIVPKPLSVDVSRYDGIVVVSSTAAQQLSPLLSNYVGKLFAVGKSSAAPLRPRQVIYPTQSEGSEVLLPLIPDLSRVLIVEGDRPRGALQTGLSRRGIACDSVTCYETHCVTIDEWPQPMPNVVLLSSVLSAKTLAESESRLGAFDGKTMALSARILGQRDGTIIESLDATAIAEALIEM